MDVIKFFGYNTLCINNTCTDYYTELHPDSYDLVLEYKYDSIDSNWRIILSKNKKNNSVINFSSIVEYFNAWVRAVEIIEEEYILNINFKMSTQELINYGIIQQYYYR